MRRTDLIQKAIALGRLHGFVTFDQLNELLPSDATTPEDIEEVMEALSDEGINVVEGN